MEKPPFQFGPEAVFTTMTAVALLFAFPSLFTGIFMLSIAFCQAFLIWDQHFNKRAPPEASPTVAEPRDKMTT
jgi:hypothetical protein